MGKEGVTSCIAERVCCSGRRRSPMFLTSGCLLMTTSSGRGRSASDRVANLRAGVGFCGERTRTLQKMFGRELSKTLSVLSPATRRERIVALLDRPFVLN